MVSKYESIQEEVWLTNCALHGNGLVTLPFCNISVANRKSGIFSNKAEILRPSSKTPTHSVLLNRFTKAGSIVHTHSPKAVAFAQGDRTLDCFGANHADYIHGTVPITRDILSQENVTDYELNTGKVILKAFENREATSTPAVLVIGHGRFTWGVSWKKAIENTMALEICAAMAIDTLLVSHEAKPLCAHPQKKHHSRKHGPKAYYRQPYNRKLLELNA